MHRRFRKKSDVKSTEFSIIQTQNPEQYGFLPELPPESDFRTSLILPDLSRRFSLLRSPTGDPVTVDDLKSRFAEQRARGAVHQISEEEEDMLFDTLGIGRSRSRASGGSQEFIPEGDDTITSKLSARSGNTSSSSLTPSSVNSSPSRPSKRYSNNLFGSGRLRDYSHLKNVASVKSNGSTRTNSFTPTEASMVTRANTSSVAESLRPVTPEGTSTSLSVQSSPNDKSSLSSAMHASSTSHTDQSMSAAEYRISKTLGPSVLKRASLALEEAIKELEDEADDEIVMPRSPPVSRSGLEQQSNMAVRDSAASRSSSIIEAGMAISFDKHGVLDERRASPIPARTLPGYIPGMPRPMTPRDFDLEEQRSHSTTPRAATPTAVAVLESGSPSCNSTSGVHKRESFGPNSRQSARPTTPSSPLFLQRSPNGRHTPDDSLRGDPIEFDSPANSSIIGRRRPASPLSGPPYQPMSVPSRPTTPSNVVWAPRTSETGQWAPGHSRDNSWVSDGGISSSDVHGSIDRHILGPPTRPPALPESTTADRSTVTAYQTTSSNNDAGSLAAFRMPRSSTPTQSASRSPVSSTFPETSSKNGKRSSKHNTPSPPFNFGPYPSSLAFSPLVNSSRSSLESVGSSFHSWDGEKDRTFSLFSDTDPLQPAWHDFPEKSSNTTPDGSPRDEWDAEDVVKTISGLKKADFMAIQEKLVGVAILKAMNPEYRERAPSSMRRRRPSTSQSNYSARVASPAPPASPTLISSPTPFDLLKSIVDNSPHRDPPAALYTTSSTTNTSPLPDTEVSPTTRRNRDLAQVLFGQEEQEQEPSKKIENPSIDSLPTPTNESLSFNKPDHADTPASPVSPQTPYQLSRNPSTPRIPQTPQEEADLTREVQQKTNAAMFALKGVSSSNAGGLSHSPSVTHKRINTTQISTPRLVSASTSVDTIPLRSPTLSGNNNVGPSKIGSRIKKLTGSLRAKNVTSSGEETTAHASDHKAPPNSQAVGYDLAKMRSGEPSAPLSATQSGSFKVPIPNPPASAGPGLRGFMARFRAKQRFGTSSETEHRLSPQPRLIPLSPQLQQPQTQARPQFQPKENSILPPQPPQVQSPEPPSQEHQRQDGWSRAYSTRSDVDSNPSTPRPGRVSPETSLSHEQEDVSASEANETALRQLFDAAARVGLDSSAISALNDLVKRSGSVSSRPIDLAALTRNASTSTAHPSTQQSTQLKVPESDRVQRTESDETTTQARDTPPTKRASPHVLEVPQEVYRLTPEPTRRPRQGLSENASNAVIRRTIIYPNDLKMAGPEVNTVTRKNSRRRRASANSISTRSVHDRAPTPPPPKSPTSKRFSSEGSPPVPHLPHAHARPAPDVTPSSAAPAAIEKSNSMYDSLYDMYGDVHSRAPSSAAIDPNDPKSDFSPSTESRTGIEVVELANGETIWSIVKGLRDDEEEEYGYGNRASFASEYSNGDGIQGAFKEHARSGSKGSVSSAVSRKAQGKNRPETKVYFSSSAHIGRLIEGLSQGKEAASFNFIPSRRGVGHSASSSLSTTDWTVEERLEQMLGSINNV